MSKGKVFIVGAGPHDPGLITLKAIDCLKKADVVIYDYLANPVFLQYTRPNAEITYAGKKGPQHTLTQDQINELMVKKASEGKIVTRFKGGDPFVFGRGSEEAEFLADHGISFEIVPGITSAIAAPAYAGIALTDRRYTSTVAFITGHEDPTKDDSAIDWDKLSTGIGTLVFLMGIKNLPKIVDKVLKAGRIPSTPCAVIQWGTSPRQKTVTARLDEIVKACEVHNIKTPSIIVIGNSVNLRNKLKWFEKKPLFGRKIVVTRAREQASELSIRLYELGAEPLEFPTIKISPVEDYSILDKALKSLDDYHLIIFTSVNGVKIFFERLRDQGMDARALGKTRIAAIGKATAEYLEGWNIKADIVPDRYQAEGLLEALGQEKLSGMRILLPRSREAREILPEKLEEMGAKVDVIPVYRTVLENTEQENMVQSLQSHEIDAITFASSSTVLNFIKMLKGHNIQELLRDVLIASIGPITSNTARELGITVSIEAKIYTIEALVESLVEHFSNLK